MNIEKICRCCLTNESPLISIYDDGVTNNNKTTLADMIREIAKIKPEPNDKLPDKACISCIRDINQSFAFKLKCENSNRTLLQLFCSIAQVELQNPFNCPTSIDITQDQMPPVDPITYTHNDECGHNVNEIVKEETNLECSIPKSPVYRNEANTLTEECISIPSSPISFRNCSPKPTNTYLDNHIEAAELSGEMTDNQQEFSDTDSNSYDLEFISENPEIHEPIVILNDDEQDVIYNTNNVDNENVADIELTFQNISSPQWIGEEDESFLSLVNEDLNFENVQTLNKKNLKKRNRKERNDDRFRYKCIICEKDFFNKIEFSNHFDTHEKPYSCSHCDNLFDDYLSLQVHLSKHTNDSITSYKDSKNTQSCLKSSTKKPNRSRKRIQEKRFTCEYCQMKFFTSCVLVNHRRIHTGEKPYKCRYCDKTFIQSSTRSNHEKTHTGERRFKCQYCDKSFIQKGTCSSHEMVHTGSKPYKCRFCDKRFTQQGVLQTHETTHTKDKPFKCSICTKGFLGRINLKKHETDHGKDDIKCPQCDVWFVNLIDVREHIIIYHSSLTSLTTTVPI